jgi:hypothetical protein
MRNRVERFFRHLKERTIVFHHKLSARDHVQGINNLKLFLNLFTLYYQTIRIGGEQECLFGHYLEFNSKSISGEGVKRVGRGRLGHPRSIWEALKGGGRMSNILSQHLTSGCALN